MGECYNDGSKLGRGVLGKAGRQATAGARAPPRRAPFPLTQQGDPQAPACTAHSRLPPPTAVHRTAVRYLQSKCQPQAAPAASQKQVTSGKRHCCAQARFLGNATQSVNRTHNTTARPPASTHPSTHSQRQPAVPGWTTAPIRPADTPAPTLEILK